MLHILLIRPGQTDFDEQGRIKGTLDLPLNAQGSEQAARTAGELSSHDIDVIYLSPCRSCEQTGEILARGRDVKLKSLKELRNVDHGLWHGKRIDEVKLQQPKVYRQGQEHPETVCPPGGESLGEARRRVEIALAKLLKKHKDGVVAIVVPEPLTTVVRSLLNESSLGDLWKAECNAGGWEQFDLPPGPPVAITSGE